MFTDSHAPATAPNFMSCSNGKQLLLLDPHYREAWSAFRELIPLSDLDFEQYYTATLIKFAEYVQTLPATQHLFYSSASGFFQLGFDRAIIATKLALQAYQDFEGVTTEELTPRDLSELFAIFSAALLSDLGLLNLRFEIKVSNAIGAAQDYDPYAGSMLEQGRMFFFQFRNRELTDWPAPASLVLAQHVLSRTQTNYADSAFAWISRDHEILQLWYSMLLDLTPAQEISTRRRFFISLIPAVDNDIAHNFLVNIHNNGALFPGAKQNLSLFVPQDHDFSATEINPDNSELEQLRKNQESSGFEKLFGGAAMADASSSQLPGSISATMPPLLRQGLAFLGWLLAMARNGRLAGMNNNGEIPNVFGLGGGNVALNLKQMLQQFSKDTHFSIASAQELAEAIAKTTVLSAQKFSITTLAFNDNPATQFQALILPARFIFDAQHLALASVRSLLNIPLGLGELKNALTVQKSKPSMFEKHNRAHRFLLS
jgi:hypothetical protein